MAKLTPGNPSSSARAREDQPTPAPRRTSRLNSFWKALIITSFVMNAILIFVVLLLVGFVLTWRNQLMQTGEGGLAFARNNVAEGRCPRG